jgi:hypothetical protein
MDNMRRHAQLTICGVFMSAGLAWVTQVILTKGWGQALIPGACATAAGLVGIVWTVRGNPSSRRGQLKRAIKEGHDLIAIDFDGNLWRDWTDGARAVVAEHFGPLKAHEFSALRNPDDASLRGGMIARVAFLETLLWRFRLT